MVEFAGRQTSTISNIGHDHYDRIEPAGQSMSVLCLRPSTKAVDSHCVNSDGIAKCLAKHTAILEIGT